MKYRHFWVDMSRSIALVSRFYIARLHRFKLPIYYMDLLTFYGRQTEVRDFGFFIGCFFIRVKITINDKLKSEKRFFFLKKFQALQSRCKHERIYKCIFFTAMQIKLLFHYYIPHEILHYCLIIINNTDYNHYKNNSTNTINTWNNTNNSTSFMVEVNLCPWYCPHKPFGANVNTTTNWFQNAITLSWRHRCINILQPKIPR